MTDGIVIALLAVVGYIVVVRSRNEFEHEVLRLLREIRDLLRRPVAFKIFQLEGCMAVTGIQAGGQGTFQATPLPAGSKLPDGVIPQWSSDQSSVQLQPSGDGLQVVATVPVDATFTSFQLSVQALVNGQEVSGSAAVPVVQAAPPPVSSFQIDQVS